MNEKLQYATMLEIPVSTCSITERNNTKKRRSRKKKVNHEQVKQQLMDKINDGVDNAMEKQSNLNEQSQASQVEVLSSEKANFSASKEMEREYGEQLYSEQIFEDGEQKSIEDGAENAQEEYVQSETSVSVYSAEKKKRVKPRISIIGVQLAVIGLLVVTIFLTNALYVDSGINVFLRGVFGVEESTVVDARTFDEFTPVIALGDNEGVTLADGVISYSGEGSVYAPCNGVVTAKTVDDLGKITLEITHSSNFKTVLSGVDIAYVELDDKVYGNIPVGYLNADGATMCFTHGDGTVISDYQIVDGAVVWAV
ncbi:MAG: hypothetical protein IJV95_04040 [Clostridia bacterium]|nr:hypothetical protein [Clostridia bacterium]